jgi:hypothetical protein
MQSAIPFMLQMSNLDDKQFLFLGVNCHKQCQWNRLSEKTKEDALDSIYGNGGNVWSNVELIKVITRNQRLNINGLLNRERVPIILSAMDMKMYEVVKLLIADERVKLNE